jgi:3-oxoacyl-[acyl-carrier-protein] synthase-1
MLESTDTLREKGVRRVGPYMVTKTMSSGVAAALATGAEIKGVNYGISSACSTSAHCIGAGVEQIQLGKQDIVFAGGAEEEHWTMSFLFDAMGALSTKYNETPDKASRTYDADRDGFVISGGGGIVVLEEYEHAKARGAKIYAEVVGYGATSDGYDMVAPSGEGAVRCMRLALEGVEGGVDYINTHGTSTPVGDTKELEAILEVFGNEAYGQMPAIASTKSLSGHALGAAGVNEAIYTLLMMENNFIAASANIETLDPAAEGLNIVRKRIDNTNIQTALSNSFGFGGTNATLTFSRRGL